MNNVDFNVDLITHLDIPYEFCITLVPVGY